MTDDEMDALAERVAAKIEITPGQRALIREVALVTLVEQEAIRVLGVVHNFLDACRARMVKVTIDKAGRIWCRPREKLGADLAAILHHYRADIAARLEQMRRAEERDRNTDFHGRPTNGQPHTNNGSTR